MLVLFLSCLPQAIADTDHDSAINVSLGVLSGVMTGTGLYNYSVLESSRVLVRYDWQNGAGFDDPSWSTDSPAIEIRFVRLKIADRCFLELEILAAKAGESNLTMITGDHRMKLKFTVR